MIFKSVENPNAFRGRSEKIFTGEIIISAHEIALAEHGLAAALANADEAETRDGAGVAKMAIDAFRRYRHREVLTGLVMRGDISVVNDVAEAMVTFGPRAIATDLRRTRPLTEEAWGPYLADRTDLPSRLHVDITPELGSVAMPPNAVVFSFRDDRLHIPTR